MSPSRVVFNSKEADLFQKQMPFKTLTWMCAIKYVNVFYYFGMRL